jgi:integrase/recombinase XerD
MQTAIQPVAGAANIGSYAVIAATSDDDQLVALWLASGKRAHSAATQSAYLLAWRQFRQAVGKPLQSVRLDDLVQWVEGLQGKPATVRAKVAAIKSLFSFALKVGYLRANPALLLETPATPDTSHRKALTFGEVELMLRACRNARESALIWALYASGARISEILALRWQDVSARENGGAVLHILSGKGRKQREAGIGAKAYAALLALRSAEAGPGDFIFATATGKPLDRQAAHETIKRIARRAGVVGDVSAHWLRHSHATHVLRKGGNVADLQKQLGHASLATTSRYAHAASYTGDLLE